MTATQFVLRPYVPAKGVMRYTDRKLITPLVNGEPAARIVGGVIILRDKVLAFAKKDGAAHLVQGNISDILRGADRYEWGSSKMEALAKLRPYLDGADAKFRPGDSLPSVSNRETVAIGDFGAMIALFDGAKQDKKGPPYAKILCEDMTVKLSVAKPGTTAPGTINVSTGTGEESRWFGRILRDGRFEKSPREKAPAALEKALQDFARDPLAAMVAFGRRTGACAVCSRKLTKGESIDRGIGPICAARLGF